MLLLLVLIFIILDRTKLVTGVSQSKMAKKISLEKIILVGNTNKLGDKVLGMHL